MSWLVQLPRHALERAGCRRTRHRATSSNSARPTSKCCAHQQSRCALCTGGSRDAGLSPPPQSSQTIVARYSAEPRPCEQRHRACRQRQDWLLAPGPSLTERSGPIRRQTNPDAAYCHDLASNRRQTDALDVRGRLTTVPSNRCCVQHCDARTRRKHCGLWRDGTACGKKPSFRL